MSDEKRILSVALTLCMLFSVLPQVVFAGGTVTPDYTWYTADMTESTFTISTVSELLGFANLVNGTDLPAGVSRDGFGGKTVKLANDLDLSGISNWTPIGDDYFYNAFNGVFDGDGHTISNLTVTSSGTYDEVGLFGGTWNATVKNLAVSGSLTGTGTHCNVGGIVGYGSYTSRIENCSFSGSVTGGGAVAGGIAGDFDGEISKCSSFASVDGGAWHIGGVVGYTGGAIRYCYNHGNITLNRNSSSADVGGIVGNLSEYGTMSSCYNTGVVSATGTSPNVGGAVGFVEKYGISLGIEGVYYLDSAAAKGIGKIELDGGYTGVNGNAMDKSADAFGSGEVAWLLQNAVGDGDGQVWGQVLTGNSKDEYPVFATADGSNTVYKVTFKVDGKDDQVRYVNKGGTVSIDAPTAPNGYTFNGWNTKADGSGAAYSNGQSVTNLVSDASVSAVTLYAQWKINNYSISYTLNDGTATNPTAYTVESEEFTLTNPTKSWYTFTGWSGTGLTGENNMTVTIPKGSTGNRSYTAHYSVKSNYTVTFDTAGGTAVNAKTSVKWTDKVLDGVANPTRAGYLFNGWKCEGVKVQSTTKYSELAANDGVLSVTLTAQWKQGPSNTLRLDGNGGLRNGSSTYSTYTNAASYEMFTDTEYGFVREGYAFKGWNTKADGSGDRVAKGDDVRFTCAHNGELIVLYAQWLEDGTAPVISGVENGKTYCGAPTVTVSDNDEIKSVTVNDEPVTLTNGTVTLSPAEGEQRIVATDKAGNKTEMTVTVNDGHTGGTADCTHKAKCGVCGEEYGEIDETNHADEREWTTKNAEQHEQTWKCCGAVEVALENHEWKDGVCTECGYVCAHTGGTADCVHKAKCEACGEEYGEADSSKHTGGTADCAHKAKCEACGEEYGEVNADNHTTLKHIEAKAATVEAEGNTEYWHCEDCGRYFSDKDGKNEIGLADTVIAKLPGDQAPETGDTGRVIHWVVLLALSGGALIGTAACGKKRKRSAK